nr:hypothetical protein [Tanacetum cinerariifolium]
LKTTRRIIRERFNLRESVADMVSNGTWKTRPDCMKNIDGQTQDFTVQVVWDSIRPRGQELKTQDMLRQWDVGEHVDLTLLRCSLCKLVQDSHEHLFFECPFSLKVWNLVVQKAGLHNVPSRLEDIISWLNLFL